MLSKSYSKEQLNEILKLNNFDKFHKLYIMLRINIIMLIIISGIITYLENDFSLLSLVFVWLGIFFIINYLITIYYKKQAFHKILVNHTFMIIRNIMHLLDILECIFCFIGAFLIYQNY